MAEDRLEDFRYDLGIGTVRAVYPATWECDIADDEGIIQRALVVGPRQPKAYILTGAMADGLGSEMQKRVAFSPCEVSWWGPQRLLVDFVASWRVGALEHTIRFGRVGIPDWDLMLVRYRTHGASPALLALPVLNSLTMKPR